MKRPFEGLKTPTTHLSNTKIDRLKGVTEFFCGDLDKPCDSCAWDILGRPWRGGKQHGCYPNQMEVVNKLLSTDSKIPIWRQKHVCLLASRGWGKSELFLRLIGFLCCRDDSFKGSEVIITTGNRLELSVALCSRLKALFDYQLPPTKETQAILNGCIVNCYPASHSVSIRGIEKCVFAAIDEASTYSTQQAHEIQDVIQGLIPKSNPYIFWCGTPSRYGDLLYEMFDTDPRESIYTCIRQDYTQSQLYSKEDILRSKKSKSFGREMLLSYNVGSGTAFNPKHLDSCIISNPQPFEVQGFVSLGVDPAYSFDGSKFAIVATAINPQSGKARVLFAKKWGGLSNSQSVDIVKGVLGQLGFNYNNLSQFRCFIDSAAPGLCVDLKPLFFESSVWPEINYLKDLATQNKIPLWQTMLVCPTPFTHGLEMLRNVQTLISDSMIEIPSNFHDLILELRIARLKTDGNLDKSGPTDLLDALRLSCVLIQRHEVGY